MHELVELQMLANAERSIEIAAERDVPADGLVRAGSRAITKSRFPARSA